MIFLFSKNPFSGLTCKTHPADKGWILNHLPMVVHNHLEVEVVSEHWNTDRPSTDTRSEAWAAEMIWKCRNFQMLSIWLAPDTTLKIPILK